MARPPQPRRPQAGEALVHAEVGTQHQLGISIGHPGSPIPVPPTVHLVPSLSRPGRIPPHPVHPLPALLELCLGVLTCLEHARGLIINLVARTNN